jgi:hypothetical protein
MSVGAEVDRCPSISACDIVKYDAIKFIGEISSE